MEQTADLGRLGERGRTELLSRLDDLDSVVRFWAVTGLCSLGTDKQLVPTLKRLLADESISVSLAAGDYLARAGEGTSAIPAFARALASRSDERRVGKECRSRWSPHH